MELNKRQIKLIGSSVKTLNYEGNELCVILDGYIRQELKRPNITHRGNLLGLEKSPCWISPIQMEDAYGKWHRLLYRYNFKKKKEWFCYPVKYQFLIDSDTFIQGHSVTNPDSDFFLSISPVSSELVDSLLNADWTKFVFVYPVIAVETPSVKLELDESINPQGIEKPVEKSKIIVDPEQYTDEYKEELRSDKTSETPKPFFNKGGVVGKIGEKNLVNRTGKLPEIEIEDIKTYERTTKKREREENSKDKPKEEGYLPY